VASPVFIPYPSEVDKTANEYRESIEHEGSEKANSVIGEWATAMKVMGVMLSRSTAEAKNLATPATEHEILRPEPVLSRVEGASE
jgi:hypothetical protein